MKKNFMTRVLAVAMSAAMALSMATATNLTVAEAASAPAMKNASFTVRVGNAAKTYRATAATRKAYKIVKAAAGNADKATAKIVKSGKAVAITAGTKTGKTVITLTFKNRKTAAKKTVKFSGKVLAAAEELAIKEVKQITSKQLVATMSTALAEVSADNFSIVRKSDNNITVVSAAKVDGKEITIDTFTKMADGQVYVVTYKDKAGATVSAEFTATDAVIAALDVTPTTVTADKPTKLYYLTKDANGIIIDKKLVNDLGTNFAIKSKQTIGGGYINADKIYLAAVGDAMEVTVEYHTYKYDTTGEVGAITNTVTVTAVADATTLDSVAYTMSNTNAINWKRDTLKTSTAVGDGANLYIRMTDSNGDDCTADSKYVVKSSDPSIAIITGDVKNGETTGISVTPVSAGTVYALIQDKDGQTIKTLPLVVNPKRKLTSIIPLGPSSVTIATSSSINYGSYEDLTKGYLTFQTLDQYGDPIGATLNAELVAVPDTEDIANKAAITAAQKVTTSQATIAGGLASYKVEGGDRKQGQYVYTIEAVAGLEKVKTSLTINTVNPYDGNNTASKAVVFVKNTSATPATSVTQTSALLSTIDTTVDALNGDGSLNVAAFIVEKRAGVITRICTTSAIEGIATVSAVKLNGVLNPIATRAGITGSNANYANIAVRGASGVSILQPGSYTIEILTKAGEKFVNTFSVTNSQYSGSVVVHETSTKKTNSVDSFLKTKENATFLYDGIKQVNANGNTTVTLVNPATYIASAMLTGVETVNDYYVVDGKTVVVKKVPVQYTINTVAGPKTVTIVVPVNQVLTTTTGTWTW